MLFIGIGVFKNCGLAYTFLFSPMPFHLLGGKNCWCKYRCRPFFDIAKKSWFSSMPSLDSWLTIELVLYSTTSDVELLPLHPLLFF